MNGNTTSYMEFNGEKYEVYLPTNITPDTKIVTYEHGSGDSLYSLRDWGVFKEKFASEGSNSIVIRSPWKYNNGNIVSETGQVINQLVDTYNLNPSNVVFDGFSAGGAVAIKDAVTHIKRYPDADPPIISMTDGDLSYHMPTLDEIATLKEKNAVVVAFVQKGQKTYLQQYKELSEAGLNVLIATDSSMVGNHQGMNSSFIRNNLLEFTTGEGNLPNKYEFMTYNSFTGELEKVDSSLITDRNSVYNLFGVSTASTGVLQSFFSRFRYFDIRSDRGTLEGYLGDITEEINGTKFMNGGIENFSLESTTNVPALVSEAVKKHFSSTSVILSKITNLTSAIRQIDEAYQETDKKLSDEVAKTFL